MPIKRVSPCNAVVPFFQALEKTGAELPSLGTAPAVNVQALEKPCVAVSNPRKPALAVDHPLAQLCNEVTVCDDATTDEIALAMQKRDFVVEVLRRAREEKLPHKLACVLVAQEAASSGLFSRLQQARGKKAAGLLQPKAAYPNFRTWQKKLGRTRGGQAQVSDWRLLLPGYRSARTYTPKGDERFYTLLNAALLCQNGLGIRAIYEECRKRCISKLGDAVALQLPTLSQVYTYARKHDRKQFEFARSKRREWALSNGTYTARKPPAPGVCWVGDHHHLDFWVLVADEKNQTFCTVRPWLSLWLDWGSFAPAGWLIRAGEPDAEAVLQSLRHGIRRMGLVLPRCLYMDNGKDYRSLALDHCINALALDRLHAIPHNPPSKIVERFFSVVIERFSRWWSSYCGNSPLTRPDAVEQMRKLHPEQLPTLAFCQQMFEVFVREHLERPSQSKSCRGLSPSQVLAAAKPVSVALDEKTIHRAFLHPVGLRTIRKGGEIQVYKWIYRDPPGSERPLLWRNYHNIESVFVKLDRDDLTKAYCFDAKGREICCVEKVQEVPGLVRYDEDPETLELFKQQVKQRRKQMRGLKDAVAIRTGQSRMVRTQTFYEGQPALPVRGPRRLPAHATTTAAEPETTSTPEMLAELDESLRAQTDARLRSEGYAQIEADARG